MTDLTERDLDLLRTLDQLAQFVRPMDCGGSDGSHHATTLQKLVRLGFAARTNMGLGQTRRTWHYRITRAGVARARQRG